MSMQRVIILVVIFLGIVVVRICGGAELLLDLTSAEPRRLRVDFALSSNPVPSITIGNKDSFDWNDCEIRVLGTDNTVWSVYAHAIAAETSEVYKLKSLKDRDENPFEGDPDSIQAADVGCSFGHVLVRGKHAFKAAKVTEAPKAANVSSKSPSLEAINRSFERSKARAKLVEKAQHDSASVEF